MALWRDCGRRGLTRAIGVCNFTLPMIRHAVDEVGAPIAALQIEYHPYLSQAPILAYLRSKGIPLTAYAPLAQGRAASDETLAANRPQARCQRGAGGHRLAAGAAGVIVIPKAGRPESQKANIDCRAHPAGRRGPCHHRRLAENLRYVSPPFAPDWNATSL